MTRRCLVPLCLLLVLAGCTDTIDSVTREYRNTNNEAVDALMMTTSEAQAKAVIQRVFKTLRDRYELSDGRLNTVRTNRVRKDFAKELFESESAHMYFTELAINRQRFGLEMARLRNLLKQTADEKREALLAKGENAARGDKDLCPALGALVLGDLLLAPLRKQLEEPKLVAMMSEIPGWQLPNYDEQYKNFLEKRKNYATREFKFVD